jgi:glycosyltransferase involved in cell wall biosynthesis
MIKRILYISGSARLGGGEMVLLNIVRHMREKNFDPVVLLPERGPLENALKEGQICFGIVWNRGYYSKFHFISFLWCALQYAVWILKEDIALVHVNGLDVCRPVVLAALLTFRKIVCHVHYPPQQGEIEYSLAIRPDAVIGCCEDVARRVEPFLGPVPRKTFVRALVNAIDTERFRLADETERDALRTKLNLPQDQFVVVTVGDLSARKGQKDFLAMAEQVLKTEPRTLFLVIGMEKKSDLGFQSELKTLRRELNIEKQVIFLGFKSNVHDYLMASDILVHPSYAEGLPLVVLEAFGCGTAVVATNVNGTPEAVIHGETGFLVDPGDVHQFSVHVLELLQDKAKRGQLVQNANRYLNEFFNLKRYMSDLSGLYSDILDGNGRLIESCI